MAKITTITNPLTGQPAQVDQLDHTAQQIDDGLNIARNVSNPNLLDNWYFGNPVNQRGKTEYTEEGYSVDRIYFHYVEGSALSVTSNGLTLRNPNGAWFGEKVPNELFSGRTITFSALIDGNLVSFSFVAESSIIMDSSGLTFYPNFGGKPVGLFYYQPSATSTMAAWKIELGTNQTLAHQENGVWVLNEIPDYGEQLERCQMYRMQYGLHAQWVATQVQTDYIDFSIYLPVSMRKAPSIEGASYLRVYNQIGNVSADDFTFSVVAFSGNNVRVRAVKTNHGYTSAVLEAAGAVAFIDEL